MKEILRLDKICKKMEFRELLNINLNLFEGEIHAIILRSETLKNGLIKLLSGNDVADSGSIYFDDHKVNILSVNHAKQLGIFSVHQRSQLISNLNVADNIFINRDNIFSQRDIIFKETDSLLQLYGIKQVNSHNLAQELSFALGHIIEIIKAVTLGAKILILDNITVRYNALELSRLITVLQNLIGKGLSIVFFVNSYCDLLDVANRVTIIRNGTTCGNIDHVHVSRDLILSILAGFPIADYHSTGSLTDDNILTADKNMKDYCLSLINLSNNEGLHNININLRHGEILGILDTYRDYGMQLVDILTNGSPHSGCICMDGRNLFITSQKDSVQKGLGLINSNSDSSDIFYNLSLIDNITLMMPNLVKGFEKQRIKKFLFRKSLEAIHCEDLIDIYGKEKQLPALDNKTKMKVLFAKWICAEVKVLILVNPHSFFDDINIYILKQLLKDICTQGISVLIVSSSMQPLLNLCNHVTILYDGTVKNILEE